MMNQSLKAFVLCLFFGLFGCGSGSISSGPPVVSIFPSVVQLSQGATEQFSSDSDVIWSVSEGSAGGTITTAGAYTAPNVAGTFHVIATSRSDPGRSATATINVSAITGVSISPNKIGMTTGESVSFTAKVNGTVNQAVSWTVLEAPTGGSITGNGTYTAPGAFGTFHVLATSQADTSQSAQVVVTVQQASVSVSPSADVLGLAGVRSFFASVVGAMNHNVIWSVQEGVSGGSITTQGVYTAPGNIGNFHAVATTVADPSVSSAASISVVAHGFRPTGNLADGRSGHSATLLPSGKVLVAGGDAAFFFSYYYGNSPLNTAELYDPSSGTFSSTGKMAVPRVFHTATLLTSGKVLVAGGNGPGELFDPGTGTFTSTGDMTVRRSSHTATLLPSGKVLIVGGQSVSGDLNSAELYDPGTGAFTATGSLANSRSFHSATLLPNGKVLITGGVQSGNALASAELYDPSSGVFADAGKMTTARAHHTATLLTDGTVLVAGGTSGQGPFSTSEIYNPATNIFVAGAPMVKARDSHIAVQLPSGMVLLAGGPLPASDSITAEIYDPVTGTFTQTGSMSTGRALAAAALLSDGRVLVTGGSDTASADIFQ
jgi:hypothetical protein